MLLLVVRVVIAFDLFISRAISFTINLQNSLIYNAVENVVWYGVFLNRDEVFYKNKHKWHKFMIMLITQEIIV